MSRRPRDGNEVQAPADRRVVADARLDDLRAVYHPGATERLRLRFVAELGRVHADQLGWGDRASADAVLAEMRRVVCDDGGPKRLFPRPSRLVQEQGLHFAIGLVDTQHRAAGRRDYGRIDRLHLELARARRFAPDNPEMDDLWCDGLRWAHLAAVRTDRYGVAQQRLGALRELARGPRECRRTALARALGEAHAAAVGGHPRNAGRALLAELRGIAARAHASTDQRAAFTAALRRAHRHAGPGERAGLLTELAHWANRPGATEEMRRDHANATLAHQAGVPHGDLPLSVLRVRAYRSDATSEDTGALFARLESMLDLESHAFGDWMTHLSELRELASRPDAPAELRLRFAHRWLTHRVDACQRGALDNDRAVYLWVVASAHRGEAMGQLLLGHCYRQGRGASRSDRRAWDWYRRAAAQGSSEAEFWLRYSWPRRDRWLIYRGPALTAVGLALLVAYAWSAPPTISLLGVALYLILQFTVQFAARSLLLRWRPEPGDGDAWSSARLIDFLRRRPWRLLTAAAEDGLILVPLLWVGVSPWAAAVAGAAFGFLHYPAFGWRSCVAKGIDYFVTALLFLPAFGLWTVALGHIVFDTLVVIIASRPRARPPA